MNKLFIFVILLLLSFFVVSCSLWVVQPNPRTTEFIKKSVVKISSKNRQGTGFVVGVSNDKAYIITVSHVVEGDPNPTIEFFGDQEFKAKVLGNESQENGLALLSVDKDVPDEVIPLYLVKQQAIKSTDKFFTVGFPRGGARCSYDTLSFSGRNI